MSVLRKVWKRFNAVIRRFSTHPMAQEAYVEIIKTFKAQIKSEYLDIKCYQFALLNQKRFMSSYPNSKWKAAMDEAVQEIVDLFAEEIYKNALYYEKKDLTVPAIMNYEDVIAKYPTSKYAQYAREKLAELESQALLIQQQEQKIDLDAPIMIGSQ